LKGKAVEFTIHLMEKWNKKYRQLAEDFIPEAAWVLREYEHLLPDRGVALDLACGMGGNALFLAKSGIKTYAWDSSPVAIERVELLAKSQNLSIIAEVKDVLQTLLPQNHFDVIVVSRFLERGLTQSLVDGLKPGGLLYYQTFVRDKPAHTGPSNPEYLLQENELLQMFSQLKLRAYCELGQVGNCAGGLRNEAILVGQMAEIN